MPLEELSGTHLIVEEGGCFGAQVKYAGIEKHVEVDLTGTGSEEILKQHTSTPQAYFKVHLCLVACGLQVTGDACGLQVTGDHYLHAMKGRRNPQGTRSKHQAAGTPPLTFEIPFLQGHRKGPLKGIGPAMVQRSFFRMRALAERLESALVLVTGWFQVCLATPGRSYMEDIHHRRVPWWSGQKELE